MIDRKPEIGRILVRDSWFTDGYFGRGGGEIVKVTAASVRYRDEYGAEKMVRRSSVAAVCDTPEEVAKLRAFSERALAEIRALREQHRAQYKELFDAEAER